MEQPVYYWTPSIAPSGAMFYTGDLFPVWEGTISFTGSLVFSFFARLGSNSTARKSLKKSASSIRSERAHPRRAPRS